MPASEDSFVMLGDDASESVQVSSNLDTTDNLFSSYDGSVPVESSTDEIFATASPDYGSYSKGNEVFESNGGSDRPILPPPFEMESEEGFALREWKRQNAIKLEEKEKREKELLKQIIEEADQYKTEFYKKREVTCQNNKATNREKEKLFLETQEKFYAESNKNYWKAIAELVPKEVPTIVKRRGKKDDEKKPLISVIQGPKPGKPTDLTRMRQILLKLKQNPPPHLKPPTSEPAPGTPDAKTASPPKNVLPEAKTTKAVTAA